jgi:hypothetical protein
MTKRTSLWIGGTLALLLMLNYFIFAMPLVRKARAINNKANSIIITRAKDTGAFEESDENYVLDILRQEKRKITNSMNTLNAVSASLGLVILSWTAFAFFTAKNK